VARVFLLNPPSPEPVRTPLLSFCHLASALREHGHEVALLDASAPFAPHDTAGIRGIAVRNYARNVFLFRAADRSLCLFSLVVPPGSMTPVHDHLAWGLVGLYKGNQDEEFYEPGDGRLRLVRQRPLQPGDYYALLPPRDDVHRVRTISDVTSVSIHLLANDTGCVLRHTFDEQTGEARPFRSGYVNAECREAPSGRPSPP